jgi:Pentapeptide repeats (8 copies)
MADSSQLALLHRGVEAWNQWREDQPHRIPDLSGATLAGLDLSGCNLSRANLRSAKFDNTTVLRASFREAELRGADLSLVSGGLQPDQLAGADLTGAKLPGALEELFKNLTSAKDISKDAQNVFIAVVAACLYCWLTIATTTDVNLITNRAVSPLPIIQTSISIVNFYVVAPLLLFGVYVYFHLYLQKLWEELASLPAVFQDGRPLYSKADPWLLSDLVRSYLQRLSSDRPFISYLQKWVSVGLAWCSRQA